MRFLPTFCRKNSFGKLLVGELSAGTQAKRPTEPTQAITSSASVPAAKRRPSSHSAPSASGSRSVALEPMPLDPDVQKGTIVLPEKS